MWFAQNHKTERRGWVPSPACFPFVLCTVGMEAASSRQSQDCCVLKWRKIAALFCGNMSSRVGDSGEGLRNDVDSEGRGGN